MRFTDVGFTPSKVLNYISKGLIFGFFTYSIIYLLEYLILLFTGNSPQVIFAIGSFSLSKTGRFLEVSIFVLVLFNIINVVMEEGMFRGFFITILEKDISSKRAMFISALLFGLWHLAMPISAYVDGDMSLTNSLILGLGYIILSGLYGYKMGLMYKITNSLWAGMADHFFNNTIINILHISSKLGVDNFQIVRISLAQIFSFLLVYYIYKKQDSLKLFN